jgi:hypothetical protein
MSPRRESDHEKTVGKSRLFRKAGLRAAAVLALGVFLFAAGVLFGRAGRDDAPSSTPVLVGFDAASIQWLDASLELPRIDGFADAADAGSAR